MKKILSVLLTASILIVHVIPVGAYSFNSNGVAIKKATAYRMPSQNSATVWWVDANDELDVICKDADFYLVLYPFNKTGKHVLAYVPTSAVSATNVPDSGKVYINDDATMIKESPLYHNPSTDQLIGASGSNQTKRSTLYKGEKVRVLFERDGFYCIQTITDTGFVPMNVIDKNGLIDDTCAHNSVKRQLLNTDRIGVNEKEYHNVLENYSVICNECGQELENESVVTQESHIDGFDNDNICEYCHEKIVCEHNNTKTETDTSITQLNADQHIVNVETYEYCTACGDQIVCLKSYTSNEPHNFKNGNVCVDCGYRKCSHGKTYITEKNSEFKSQCDMDVHLLNTVVDIVCAECSAIIESDKHIDKKEAHAFQGSTCTICGYTKFQNKTAWVATTGGARLILRNGPSTKDKEITRMPQSTEITVTGDATNGFYPVMYGNYSGYASAEFISFTKPTTAIDANFIWPVKGSGRITCKFQGYKNHNGLDIGGNPAGTSMPILASKSGTVSVVSTACSHDYAKSYNCGCNGGYGRYIKIDHGDGTVTIYAHLRSVNVTKGQTVKQGQQIAMMGTTGWSSGVHLHFEIRVNGTPQDPQKYVKY